jgi:hypothetical protein
MATIAQIFANRQNSKKSTGPKTAEGKAAVSQNAVKHGLFAESVIKGENEADYEAFHDEMLAELAPVGAVEFMLAERVVSLSWRLKRAERMQNQVIDDMMENYITNPLPRRMHVLATQAQGVPLGDPRCLEDHLPLGRVARLDWSSSRVLERMMIYEKRIESSLHKTMDELKKQQIMRQVEQQYDYEEQFEPSLRLRSESALSPPKGQAPSLRDSLGGHLTAEAATHNPAAEKNSDLKKQSQFVPGQTGAKSFVKGDYDNTSAHRAEENKANQSQFLYRHPGSSFIMT